jgi:hypothetical protein
MKGETRKPGNEIVGRRGGGSAAKSVASCAADSLVPFPGFLAFSLNFSASEQPVSNLPRISGNFRLPFHRRARTSAHDRTMQDPFTGRPTCVQGRRLPGPAERAALQDDHERRLAALHRLRAVAAECGVATDPDRDLVTLPEDAVSLLELGDPLWARLGAAIREWRALTPLRALEDFGFPAGPAISLEEASARLRYLNSGVEASAFVALADQSIYKFYRPSEGADKLVGSTFAFRPGEEQLLQAEACPGDYRALFEKLLLIDALGMATEIVGVTPEGIVVAKQTLGDPLPQGDDTSRLLPTRLIEIPSRFLRANRDHPRLFFIGTDDGGRARAWLVADLHARNFVRGVDGALHVIDIVAAPWPEPPGGPLIADWLSRVRADPQAGALGAVADADL